jgi:glutamate---cysteine ligase / carboxylate-amine ligase
MEHHFHGPRYTVGVEEELMILDGSSLDLVNAIDMMLEDPPAGEIKPELMESVLEIATPPCKDVKEAAAELRGLRARVSLHARQRGLCVGSSGTHPFAHWEDQRIVRADRYRGLVSSLGFAVRQELCFGMHVHVGMADADEAIQVANGMRAHVPLLLALSANSPFLRGQPTGLESSRVPIFRALPRVGIPPLFCDWADFERRIDFMVRSGLIDDYTYLWYDVRPHPRLGTVEVRAMDSQTRVEHTVALTALIQTLAKQLTEDFRAGVKAPDYAVEILEENKWLAARHGIEAELVRVPDGSRHSVRELTHGLVERLRPHAEDLGCLDELLCINDLLDAGNGAKRQRLVYEANHDLRELMAEIVAATA